VAVNKLVDRTPEDVETREKGDAVNDVTDANSARERTILMAPKVSWIAATTTRKMVVVSHAGGKNVGRRTM
jgi:hypothetical protein